MRKQQDGVHGNNVEIQAISELYNRPVEVFVPDKGRKFFYALLLFVTLVSPTRR